MKAASTPFAGLLCVVTNYGNGVQYTFASQPFGSVLIDAVYEKQAKLHRKMIDKYDDVKVEVGRKDRRITVTASYGYTEKTKEGHIKYRLVYLMEHSRRIMREGMKDASKALEKYKKELEERKLSHLSKLEFMYLVSDDYFRRESTEDEEAVEGFWKIHDDGRHYRIYNYGDRIVYSITLKMPDGADDDALREKVLRQAGEQVAKKQAKGASETEVLWVPWATSYLWLKATYLLDGKIEGKKFKEHYHHFMGKYSKDMHKKLKKIIEKNT